MSPREERPIQLYLPCLMLPYCIYSEEFLLSNSFVPQLTLASPFRYFSEGGRLYPSVQSWNLSCNTDHDHHAYWRLDFDIGGPDHNQVFVKDTWSTEDERWGPGWRKYLTEVDDKKSSEHSHDRVWFVRNYPTGHGVWIIPGLHDGRSGKFSDRDVSIRKFYIDEASGWSFGARGDLEYQGDENIQETHSVFWYIAHLPHKAAPGDRPIRYWMGPRLKIESSPDFPCPSF